MAKWGEGDPRWIVEERPDATNVNNWHWTERNASPWSQERIKELFKGLTLSCGPAQIAIDDIEKCDGEASANNRKGKLIFFYEWNIILNWTGKLIAAGSGTEYKGKITIPNLSEENDVTEIDIQISVKDSDDEGDEIKSAVYNVGRPAIRAKLHDYITSLKQEFSKGMILPKKEAPKPDAINNLSSGFNNKVNVKQPVVSDAKQVGTKIQTSSIKITEKLQCKAQDFYDAMTRIEMVTAFTRGAVKIDPVKGGKFQLFGGNITGQFEELVPGRKIVQRWRYKQWPEGHYSLVTIDIEEKSDHTEINLKQTGVPVGEVDVTKRNWEQYYWNSMKRTFGFGVFFTSID